jgi:hypothetical protein
LVELNREVPYLVADFDVVAFPAPDALPGRPPIACASPMHKVALWDPRGLQLLMDNNGEVNVFASAIRMAAGVPGRFNVSLCSLPASKFPNATGGMPITISSRMDSATVYGFDLNNTDFGGHGVVVVNSSRCRLEGVALRGSGAMGFVEMFGEGGHVYDTIAVERSQLPGTRAGLPRLLTTSVDAFHSAQVRRGPALINSHLAYCGDDFGNIHPRLELVLARLSNRQLYVVDTDFGWTLNFTAAGASLSFSNFSTLVLQQQQVPIAALELVTDPVVVAQTVGLQNRLAEPPYSVHIIPGDQIKPVVYKVTLAADLGTDRAGLRSGRGGGGSAPPRCRPSPAFTSLHREGLRCR